MFLLLGFCASCDKGWKCRVFENVKEKVVRCFCYCVSVFFVIKGVGCLRMLKRKVLRVSATVFLCSF